MQLAPWYEAHFGQKDPGQVVSDEVAGQSIALLGMAWLEPSNQVSPAIWIGLALYAFALFLVCGGIPRRCSKGSTIESSTSY